IKVKHLEPAALPGYATTPSTAYFVIDVVTFIKPFYESIMKQMKTHQKRNVKVYYKGKIFSLAEESTITKGKIEKIAIIQENDVAVVLPLIGNEMTTLEERYRPVLQKRIYELPAGHVEKGETPAQAAKRELKEELGYDARSMKLMFKAYPQPGSITSIHYFYYAKCYKEGPRSEKDEDIIAKKVKLSKALEMIKVNKIIDTKSIAAILYYVSFVKQK
ncbi:MAG: NUDIX hydrolase, partial [Candidatus Micrarchaeia archaeon]